MSFLQGARIDAAAEAAGEPATGEGTLEALALAMQPGPSSGEAPIGIGGEMALAQDEARQIVLCGDRATTDTGALG